MVVAINWQRFKSYVKVLKDEKLDRKKGNENEEGREERSMQETKTYSRSKLMNYTEEILNFHYNKQWLTQITTTV